MCYELLVYKSDLIHERVQKGCIQVVIYSCRGNNVHYRCKSECILGGYELAGLQPVALPSSRCGQICYRNHTEQQVTIMSAFFVAYSYIASDGQSVSANQNAQTQFTFTALSHSENYTVSVVAINSLGQQGPSAVGTVRTRDIRE